MNPTPIDSPAKLSYKEWQETQKTFKEYCLGFMFSEDVKGICLIQKETPEWQKGKFNGVGGKQEWNETAFQSMVREFKEETGVDTDINKWEYFGKMVFKTDIMGGQANVYLFRMFTNEVYKCKTKTEEEILVVNTQSALESKDLMSNLPVLINLALSKEFKPVILYGN